MHIYTSSPPSAARAVKARTFLTETKERRAASVWLWIVLAPVGLDCADPDLVEPGNGVSVPLPFPLKLLLAVPVAVVAVLNGCIDVELPDCVKLSSGQGSMRYELI